MTHGRESSGAAEQSWVNVTPLEWTALGLALGLLLALDLWATVLVVRENSGQPFRVGTLEYDPRPRRILQLLLVWLLPGLGALLILAMYGPRRPPPNDGYGPNDPIGPDGMDSGMLG